MLTPPSRTPCTAWCLVALVSPLPPPFPPCPPFLAWSTAPALSFCRHKSMPHASRNEDFYQFQKKYLLVYFLAVFADWLQGPYLYRLYEEYGYLQQQIAALYMVGYVAAMVSGPFLGGLADKHGRKKLTLIFCGLYVPPAQPPAQPSVARLAPHTHLSHGALFVIMCACACRVGTGTHCAASASCPPASLRSCSAVSWVG